MRTNVLPAIESVISSMGVTPVMSRTYRPDMGVQERISTRELAARWGSQKGPLGLMHGETRAAALPTQRLQEFRDRAYQSPPKQDMLISIEMYAIDPAGGCDGSRIEAGTLERCADFLVSASEANGLVRRANEFGRDRTFGRSKGGRNDHEHRWDWHTRLNGRLANRTYERRDPMRGVPGAVRMHGLKIVRPKHEDYERQR